MTEETIILQTLTPLWTGGTDGDSNKIHLTGIVGSLRYWYEGIVRVLGGSPCIQVTDSPDEKHSPCRYVVEDSNTSQDLRLCPVCKLFGTTGWKRRFRISMSGLISQPLFFMASRPVQTQTTSWFELIYKSRRIKGGRGILFQSSALWGRAELKIIGDKEAVNRIIALLGFMERFGAIGAKTQNGFGQFKIEPKVTGLLINEEFKALAAEIVRNNDEVSNNNVYFSIQDFFSHTYQLKHHNSYFSQLKAIGEKVPDGAKKLFYPCAFDLRYKNQMRQGRNSGLRQFFKNSKWSKKTAAKLFGTDKKNSWDQNNWASHIHVSHPFRLDQDGNWLLKIWGTVPEGLWNSHEKHPDRNEIESIINEYISGRQGMFPGSTIVCRYKKKDWFNGD
ncbi:CRISPR-associated protein, Cmr1 family [Desulfosarcina variabilis str. Montpellier]|uniref:type III-B CRISPR module RAMP protein Cmr1 n=1 Tax=Desulfosarcina variabilis TaxID=2300 RepID=UPI003AFA6ACC